MGLSLRQRQGRGPRRHARPPRRQGRGLAEMANLGLPVPPGFTITTAVCTQFYANNKRYPADLRSQVDAALIEVGRITGKGFGDGGNPLLVSVRSGGRASMPGMMDTVLNLGLNDKTVEALARKSGDPRFAYDSYRRFITMYSDVVLGLGHHHFEEILDDHKDKNGYTLDTDLSAEDWIALVQRYKERLEEEHGAPFPQDPHEQLWGAIGAVFGSWMNQRAITYRRLHNIPESWGTAVNVQAMVFGNMGADLGDRRRLHAQSLDRRQAALRRISDQCPGRGRGRRHPHAAGDHRGRARGVRLRQAVDGNRDAAGVQGADAHLRRARAPLPRHAGPRIHGRAGQAVDAADPLGQAHRQGGAQGRGRARGRGAYHPRGGGHPHRSRRARPAPASDHRSQCRAQHHRDRASGLARSRIGRDRVLGRRGRDAQGAGTGTSSWCASRRRRRTSTACTRPRAFSPPAAA